MKTLKTFLEVRRPKSPDERKFMDKHIVVKHADRNGNGDDLFNAKNIKTIKRDKEGHGYDTGKDAKVYEAKLDEAPIKLTPGWGDGGRSMRANKAKLAGKNLPNDPDTGTPDHFSAARRRKRGLSENVQTAVLEYFDEMGIEVTEVELGELVEDLQEEILGELSNQTLKSYIKKAGRNATQHDDTAETMMSLSKTLKVPNNKEAALNKAGRHAVKSVKRVKGIVKAAKKIKESNEELDELFSLTVEDLSDKNQALLTSLYESLDLENQINLVETLQEENGLDAVLDFALEEAVKSYQVSGEHKENGNVKTLSYFAKNPAHAKRQFHAYHDRKSYKVNGVKRLKEENLDELSKPLLGRYLKKADKSKEKHWEKSQSEEDKAMSTDGNKYPDKQAKHQKAAAGHDRKWFNRNKGINTALDKVYKR